VGLRLLRTPAEATGDDDNPHQYGAFYGTRRRDDAHGVLAARRASPRTITTYTTAVEQLAAYLAGAGMPTRVSTVRREHVDAWMTDLLVRRAPTTAHNRFRGCQGFFNWAVEEGEIRESPMARMKPPWLPEAPPPALRDGDRRAILAGRPDVQDARGADALAETTAAPGWTAGDRS
jgi:site-specific recombinase XerD